MNYPRVAPFKIICHKFQEVEDILSGDSSSDSSDAEVVFKSSQNGSVDSSDDDSMTGEFPRGHKRKNEERDSSEDSLNGECKRSKEELEQVSHIKTGIRKVPEIHPVVKCPVFTSPVCPVFGPFCPSSLDCSIWHSFCSFS